MRALQKFQEQSKQPQSQEAIKQPNPIDLFLNTFRSPHTKSAYRTDLKLFLGYLEANGLTPAQVKPLHITDFLSKLQDDVAPKTFQRRISTIKSFYSWAVRNDFMDKNPADAIEMERANPVNPTQALTDAEAMQLIETPKKDTLTGASDRLALIFLFHLGFRRSEVVAAKFLDIIDERGMPVIKVKRKSRKIHMIPLSPFVQAEIKHFREFYMFKTGHELTDKHCIIQRSVIPSTQPASTSTILKMIKKYAKILNINKNVVTHSGRATVLSQLLENMPQNQDSIRNIQEFAGHSSPYTTLLYDKKRDGLKNSSAFKVNYGNTKPDNEQKTDELPNRGVLDKRTA